MGALAVNVLMGASLGLVASVLALATGSVIGLAHRGRARGDALAFFAMFWVALGIAGAADSLSALLFALGNPGLAVAMTALQVRLVFGLLASFALVYYLLYIYRGSERSLIPLGVVYGVIFVVIEYFVAWRPPVAAYASGWGLAFTYANEGGALARVAGVLIVGPPLLATLAYASLLRLVKDGARRARLVVVSVALLVLVVGTFLRVEDPAGSSGVLVQRSAQIVVDAFVLFFVRPPASVTARYGLRPLGEPVGPAASSLPLVTEAPIAARESR